MKRNVNPTLFEQIPALPKDAKKKDRIVHAIVETPKDSPHKYALDADNGIIALHEVLPGGMRWPYDYGFIPSTLADDGDPVDILVLSQQGLFSGCLLKAHVVGVVHEKKNGVRNDRLLGVFLPSPGAPQPTDTYRDIGDVPESQRREIVDFLCSYSERQGNAIEFDGIEGAEAAMDLVKAGMKKFDKERG